MELMTAQEARDNMHPKSYSGEDVVDYHIQNINRLIYLSSQAKHNCATYEMNMSRKIRYNNDLDYERWTNWEDKLNDIIHILRQNHYDLELLTSYDVYEMRHITIKINW